MSCGKPWYYLPLESNPYAIQIYLVICSDKILFLFLYWQIIIDTLQWYIFSTDRSVTQYSYVRGMSSNCIGSSLRPRLVPRFIGWLLQMLHPSAVWGTIFSALGIRWCPGLLCGVHLWCLQFINPGGSSYRWPRRCSNARPLRLLLCFDSTRFIYTASRLSDRGYWGKPLLLLLTIFNIAHVLHSH